MFRFVATALVNILTFAARSSQNNRSAQYDARSVSALYQLFMDLFSPGELRLWLATNADTFEILDNLAEHGTKAEITATMIGALIRRGLVNRTLFTHLEEARPRKTDRIREVADICGIKP